MSARCQQFELYAAEAGLGRGRSFKAEADLQRWVDDLREQPWWDRFNPQVLRVEAHFRRGCDGSVGAWEADRGAGVIEMGQGHRCELVVLHELAHVLADARTGERCGHSPWFARTYLELVYLVMGHEAWDALRVAFLAGGIDFDPPRGDFEWGRSRFEAQAAS